MLTNSLKSKKEIYTIILNILMLSVISFGKTYSFDFSNTPDKAFSISKIASIQNSVLRADSSKTGKRWNNYLISNPKAIVIPGGRVCVVEFDYKIIKKAEFPHDHGYFYFFIRTPKGTKYDIWKRWEGNNGAKGHRRYVIKLPNQPNWRIYFGIKGQGIIELDNLKISDFDKAKSHEKHTPLYIHIGFEKNEPVRWSILQNSAKIVSDSKGNHYLLADTTFDKKRVWRRYLQLAPSQIGIKKNTCYSVQFDYKILKSPSYFQLLERGSHGWRLVMSWSGPAGHKGKGQIIFISDENRASPLIFGMKGPGAIIIDNIIIREWKNIEQAKAGLKAKSISRDEIKKRISKIKSEVSKFKLSPNTNNIISKIKFIESKLSQSHLTITDKIALYKTLQNLDRDIFKLRIINTTKAKSDSAFITFIDNSLRKIRRDAAYDYTGKQTNKADLSLAGNEYESFQIVIVPFRNITGLSLNFSDLKAKNGKTIKKENIKWYKVEYVDTKKELYPVKYVGYWPDPLEPKEKINIPNSQYAQPIWITVYAPANTPAGKYTGTITISAPNLPDRTITLTINVRNFTLPKKVTFKTSFAARDTAKYYIKWGLAKKGDPELKNLDMLYRDALLEHKLSPARISGKFKVIRKANGDYYVDFSEFDKVLTHYIKRGINSFTFGGYWGWRNTMKGLKQKFIIWPEGQNKPEEITLDVLSEPFKKLMHDYFKSWAEYLEKKGCLDDVYCYIYDEPGKGEFKKVNELLKVLHKASSRLKAIIPGIPNRHTPETYSIDVDIMCPLLAGIEFDKAKKYQALGKHSWWYVCLNPRHPYPNFFVDYPSIDHRIIFWMSWKYDVEGLLYWQTTFWHNHNPWENIETYTTTHGDGCLFYPSRTKPIKVVPSIRLENIRDGVEDYEYFAILKRMIEHIEKNNIKTDAKLLAKAKSMLVVPDNIVHSLTDYTKTPERILKYRQQLSDIIEKLTNTLTK